MSKTKKKNKWTYKEFDKRFDEYYDAMRGDMHVVMTNRTIVELTLAVTLITLSLFFAGLVFDGMAETLMFFASMFGVLSMVSRLFSFYKRTEWYNEILETNPGRYGTVKFRKENTLGYWNNLAEYCEKHKLDQTPTLQAKYDSTVNLGKSAISHIKSAIAIFFIAIIWHIGIKLGMEQLGWWLYDNSIWFWHTKMWPYLAEIPQYYNF